MKFKIIYTTLLLLLVFIFSCENTLSKKKLTQKENEEYLKKGKAITSQTFAALAGKLQLAMKEGGVPNAINYCKIHAMPIVDSLSKAHNCEIRRATLKSRNPLNQATKKQIDILASFEGKIQQNIPLSPIIETIPTNKVAYYAPIKVNSFCLQCHGKIGETLKEADFTLIKKQYPDDHATGYIDGDLRGAWQVIFKN